jgi:hypothetical protein
MGVVHRPTLCGGRCPRHHEYRADPPPCQPPTSARPLNVCGMEQLRPLNSSPTSRSLVPCGPSAGGRRLLWDGLREMITAGLLMRMPCLGPPRRGRFEAVTRRHAAREVEGACRPAGFADCRIDPDQRPSTANPALGGTRTPGPKWLLGETNQTSERSMTAPSRPSVDRSKHRILGDLGAPTTMSLVPAVHSFPGSGLTAPNSSVRFAALSSSSTIHARARRIPLTRKLFLFDMSSFRRSQW